MHGPAGPALAGLVSVLALTAGCLGASDSGENTLRISLTGSKLPVKLMETAAVWMDDSAYVFGGLEYGRPSGDVRSSSRVFSIDASDAEVREEPIDLHAPTGRAGLAAVAWKDQVVIAGGDGYGVDEDSGACFDDILRVDTGTGSTERHAGALPYPLTLAGAAVDGDVLFLFGGAQECGFPTRTILAYGLEGDSDAQRVAELPQGLLQPAVVSHAGSIYVIGGSTLSESVDTIYRFEPETGEVHDLGPLLPVPVSAASAFSDGKGIWIMGGDVSYGKSTDRVFYFSTTDGTVREPGVKLPVRNANAAIAAGGDSGYILGGSNKGDAIMKFVWG